AARASSTLCSRSSCSSPWRANSCSCRGPRRRPCCCWPCSGSSISSLASRFGWRSRRSCSNARIRRRRRYGNFCRQKTNLADAAACCSCPSTPFPSAPTRVTASLGQHAPEHGLADHKRITPEVVTVQFDEVEGVEEYALVSAVVTNEIERGNAVVIAGDGFTIDNAGVRVQAGERINDQRE